MAPLAFDSPWWLLALVPILVLTIYLSARSRAGLPSVVQKTALILRCLAFSALVLALARTVQLSGGEGLSILVLRDLSASVPRLVSDQVVEQTSNQLGTLEFPDQVSVTGISRRRERL